MTGRIQATRDQKLMFAAYCGLAESQKIHFRDQFIAAAADQKAWGRARARLLLWFMDRQIRIESVRQQARNEMGRR